MYLPREPSLSYPKKTKNPNPSPIGKRFGFFLFGGRGWIRTTEAESSRFTVCPHWPLGNTPISVVVHPFAGRLVYFSMRKGFCQLPFSLFFARSIEGKLLLFYAPPVTCGDIPPRRGEAPVPSGKTFMRKMIFALPHFIWLNRILFYVKIM